MEACCATAKAAAARMRRPANLIGFEAVDGNRFLRSHGLSIDSDLGARRRGLHVALADDDGPLLLRLLLLGHAGVS